MASMGSATMQHDWVKSTLGHGEQMCSRCFVTNREAAALGMLDHCDPPPPKAANENKQKVEQPTQQEWTQDEIDEQMFLDEEDDGDDAYEACGRWNNGHLTQQCRLAGSEWCDWDCPLSR